ncbi:PEP-CTERM sorting domain-containing protein [Mitsuaria sp. GD03876]|uniref:PEP-CTERM sorting domain-containing protein n=1 Tax=Mitsuaria sp. GD03876 TaxID=2975399 RepID=UPI00326439D4
MKPILLAASLLAASSLAHAQFNPPDGASQTVQAVAGGVTDGRTSGGSPGALNASAIDGAARASAGTRIGAGYVTGHLATQASGPSGASTSLSAYQTDALTFQRTDGGSDNALVIHYNIVIAGGTSGAIDPIAPPAGAGTEAGSLDWTFVHRLDGHYLTSWDSTTKLGYDGSVTTTSHWNVGEIGKVYGVYTFAAAVMAGAAMDMELYTQMSSRLNALGGATGSLAANGPSIYWGGISQVTDWYGNRVGYRVASTSGFNYALSAVPTSTAPEPATWAMLLAGAALLGLQRIRRSNATASSTHAATAGR